MNLSRKKILFLVLFTGLLIRLFLAFANEGTGDTGGWRLAGMTGVYQQQFGIGNGTAFDGDCPQTCFNWPPFTYHYFVVMYWLYLYANPLHLPDTGFFKLLPVLASVGIVYMIYKLAEKIPVKDRMASPLSLAAIYAFHPLSIYVAGYHGQRTTFWLLACLVTIWLFWKQKYFWAAIVFGVGATYKIPILFFSLFFLLKIPRWLDRIIFVVNVVSVFFILNLPEIATHFVNVINQVFLYPGVPGWWGFSGIINKIEFFSQAQGLLESSILPHKLLLNSAIVLANIYFAKRTKNFFIGLSGVIMTICVMTNIFAVQYLLWFLPFSLLLPPRYSKLVAIYSVVSIYMAAGFYTIHWFPLVEKIFYRLPQKLFFYKHTWLLYPMDISYFVWVTDIYLLLKMLNEKKS